METEQKDFRFFAFISYKRGEADERNAKWLQRRLENYRIPTEVAGNLPSELHAKSSPRKLTIFRDKTDLGSHANLDQGLAGSLEQCRYLILVCSPRSAASPYVADEVRFFMEKGWGDRIIPFIIDGTPAPPESPEGVDPNDSSLKQCYPPSLPRSVLGISLAEGTKEEALIKVLARLLQVDYPLLYQRHLRAQRRFMVKMLAASVVLLALVSGLALWALDAEQRADSQRKEAESLVDFLTFDLRSEAFDHIPLKAQKQISEKVHGYYEKWAAGTARARYSLAVHLYNQADVSLQSKEAEKAAELAGQALAILEQLQVDDPKQSEFAFAQLGPLSILVRTAAFHSDVEQTVRHAQKALDLAEKLVAEKPDDTRRLSCLATSLELKRIALSLQGKYLEKLLVSERAVQTAEKITALRPNDNEASRSLNSLLNEYCMEMTRSSRLDALPVCQKAYGMAKASAQADPYNIQQNLLLLHAQENLVEILMGRGELSVQINLLKERQGLLDTLIRLDPDERSWRADLTKALVDEARVRLYLREGDREDALRLLDDAEEKLKALRAGGYDGDYLVALEESIARERKRASTPLSLEEEEDRYRREAQDDLKRYTNNPADMLEAERTANSLSQLATLLYTRKKYAEALDWYGQEKELLLTVIRTLPGETKFLVELASVWTHIAKVHQSTGAHEPARQAITEALALMEKAETSGYTANLHSLGADAFLRAAGIMEAMGLFKDVPLAAEQGVLRYRKSLERDQSKLKRRGLIQALVMAGRGFLQVGDYVRADQRLEEAVALGRKAMRDPDMVQFAKVPLLLVEALHSHAATLTATGLPVEAGALLDEAGDVLRTLPETSGSAEYLKWQKTYGKRLTLNQYGLLARLELDMGRPEQARERISAMMRFAATLPEKDWEDLYVLFVQQGDTTLATFMATGSRKDAHSWFDKAEELGAEQISGPAAAEESRLLLARILLQGSALALLDKDASIAAQRASRASNLLASPAGREQAGAESAFLLALTHAALGNALAAGQDFSAAAAQYEISLELARHLHNLEPRQIRWRALLATDLEKSSEVHAKLGDNAKARARAAEAAVVRGSQTPPESDNLPDTPAQSGNPAGSSQGE